MTTRRLLMSSSFLSRLSKLSLMRRASVPTTRVWASQTTSRCFSDKKNDGEKPPMTEEEEDFFGVNFDDTDTNKLGPSLPPKYKRDAATGRFTGDIEVELSEEEKRVLEADPLEKEQLFSRRVEQHWSKKDGVDLNELGERVRQQDMGLNVLGRSVRAQASKEAMDDDTELGRDESGFTQHLTKKEFESFKEFMKKKHKMDVTEQDIPVQESEQRGRKVDDIEDPDEKELSLKWLTTRAQRQMDDLLDDNPYSDLMPGDLSPSRLVNRKRAKQIPVQLLHHNNIPLLRSFMTPTGQIQNRVQTRLGARDQRRIARLVKRARSLGLIPYVGQFKAERHGWVHAKDIQEERPWEKELIRRGLTIKRDERKKDEEKVDLE